MIAFPFLLFSWGMWFLPSCGWCWKPGAQWAAQPKDPGRWPQPLQEEATEVSEEGTGTKSGRVCAHIRDHTGSRCFTVALGPYSETVSSALMRLWEKESAGDFPGEGDGSPFQDSCLENPVDGGARWAAVHGVAQSWT